MSELDDLIEGDNEAEVAEVVEETPEVEAAEVETEDVATEGETAEPPAADEPKETHVPIAALTDERHKRQEAERKFNELQAQIEAQTPPPNPIDDPEGALEHLRGEVSKGMWEMKTDLSREMMSGIHSDYAEKEQAFIEMAQTNPALVQQMQAAPNPAKFAYETATKAAELAELQNVDEYKAKLKAELRNELLAEMKAEGDKTSQTQALIDDAADVGALATTRASNGRFVADDDLSSVLDGR